MKSGLRELTALSLLAAFCCGLAWAHDTDADGGHDDIVESLCAEWRRRGPQVAASRGGRGHPSVRAVARNSPGKLSRQSARNRTSTRSPPRLPDLGAHRRSFGRQHWWDRLCPPAAGAFAGRHDRSSSRFRSPCVVYARRRVSQRSLAAALRRRNASVSRGAYRGGPGHSGATLSPGESIELCRLRLDDERARLPL